jgi:endonuclease/exonuclease/phosphatase (EEP) superfamily protein YafD
VGFAIGLLVPAAPVSTALVVSIIGLLIIGAYAHDTSWNAKATAASCPSERQLRIVTFNTQVSNNDIDAIAAEVLRLKPNVAVLVEFGPRKRRLLNILVRDYPFSFNCGMNCQFAILSQFPLNLIEQGPWLIRVSLGSAFSNLQIIGVHLTRPPMMEKQVQQVRVLTDYVRMAKGNVVVVGDFNATPFSRVLSDFADGTGLRRLTSLPTWPSHVELPQFAIDHVFASPELRVVQKVQIGRSAGSDHYPVAVTLEVPESSANFEKRRS